MMHMMPPCGLSIWIAVFCLPEPFPYRALKRLRINGSSKRLMLNIVIPNPGQDMN